MKNIHVLSTSNPSRLLRGLEGIRLFKNEVSPDNQWCVNVNISITSDEEIKEGEPRINNYQRKLKGEEIPSKKIILTTDQDLIKDGVQAINDDFLEWFVKNPSSEEVEVIKEYFWEDTFRGYSLRLPKEEPNPFELPKALPDDVFYESLEPKQETLEEFKKRFANDKSNKDIKLDYQDGIYYGIEVGAKWQQERSYSEEDMKTAFLDGWELRDGDLPFPKAKNKWFEQFKKK